jgi:hypothetical protein
MFEMAIGARSGTKLYARSKSLWGPMFEMAISNIGARIGTKL